MFELLRMAHLIMVAMITGLVFAQLVVLRIDAGSAPAVPALASARRALGDFSTVILIFAWITGLTLLWSQYGRTTEAVSAWFYAKIGFVLLLTAAHVAYRLAARAEMRAGAGPARWRVELWAAVVWLAALLAICLAVISFARPPG